MAKVDSNTRAHLEWMGFVQPHGLVVSAPALTHAGAILNRNDVEGQALLRNCVSETDGDGEPRIADFGRFARSVLGWAFSPKFYRRMLRPSEAPDGLSSQPAGIRGDPVSRLRDTAQNATAKRRARVATASPDTRSRSSVSIPLNTAGGTWTRPLTAGWSDSFGPPAFPRACSSTAGQSA